MKKQKGFTLIELVVVIIIIGIVSTAITINLNSTSSIKVEQIITEVAASIGNVRREALKSSPDPHSTTFTLSSVYGSNPPIGITISPTSISDTNNSCQCGDNLKALCLTDQSFCYESSDSKDVIFSFELGSGRLSNNHVIFINSKTRNLALLINHEGNTEVAEFIGGAWHSKTSLQQPK